MPFAYEAVDARGKQVSSVVDGDTVEEVTERLHSQGLFVTDVSEVSQDATSGSRIKSGFVLAGRPGNARDRMLLTQQMSMMLQAGSQVVPAMDAIASQIQKPGWRQIITDICGRVQGGASLSDAMADYPGIFDETFRAVVAAGETTGATSEAFARLAVTTRKQQEIKVRVIGALVYPALLLLLCFGVVTVLLFYVLPKFDDLYVMLGAPLPVLTRAMLFASRWVTGNQLAVCVILLLATAAPIAALRHPVVRQWGDKLLLRIPVIKTIVCQLILAKVFRVWGILIRSNVPVLDALHLSRGSTRNVIFLSILDAVRDAVREGDSVGSSLSRHSLIPATMSSAISTGEQSGQLDEALLFLAQYLDEENTQMLATLTRLVEPMILVLMGFVVGTMAISLFLPLFDLTAAGAGY